MNIGIDLSYMKKNQPEVYGRYVSQIWGRMNAEAAATLSDEEIERTLRDCVVGNRLISYAKFMRYNGDLLLEVQPKNYRLLSYD